MKMISQKKLKEILHYDPITGFFTWKVKIADKISIGQRAGSQRENGYRFIRINKIRYREHRLAYLYMTGTIPTQVDHQDHTPSNNSWDNLAPADYKSNGRNHPKTKRNATGVVGVSLRKDGRYVARIYVKNKHKWLGAFPTLEAAKQCREAANIQYNFHENHGK